MRRGFSILEVLVALAITALCVGLVAAGLGAMFRANQKAAEIMELNQVLNETMARIRLYLQSAYVSPYPQNQLFTEFESFDTDSLNDPYDAVSFTSLAVTTRGIDSHLPDLNKLTLFTVEEPPLLTDEGEVELRRLRVRIGGEINDRFEVEGGMVYTLADHVTSFTLEYLGNDGDWKSEWDLMDHNSQLPCAIRVILGVRSENYGEQAAVSVIPMRMTSFQCVWEEGRVFEK